MAHLDGKTSNSKAPSLFQILDNWNAYLKAESAKLTGNIATGERDATGERQRLPCQDVLR